MATATPIRAIVGRFFCDFAYNAMDEVLRVRPFEFAAIVSKGVDPKYFTAIPRERQEWFVSSKIRSCEYAGVDWGSLAPLDEGLVESMRECECIFMALVWRLEWKREFSYQQRKRWYLRHLRFWNDYLDRNRINLYVSAWTPHEIPDVVIYELCKLKGIKVLFFECASFVRDTSFLEHDWEVGPPQIGARYQELVKEFAGVTDPMKVPLSAPYEERYTALTAVEGSRPPAYYNQWIPYWNSLKRTAKNAPTAFVGYIAQYCTPAGWKRAAGTLNRNVVMRGRNRFYDAHAVEPDVTKKYVYLPLHFQPEIATTPLAGAFVDQVLMAHMLNATLPDDVLIYVKEHPWESAWTVRSIDEYKDFLELPKVRLISRSASTFALREHCAAVATATGTAGGEALFRGKPVFLFGHRFYQDAPGVHKIHSLEDCTNAVRAIFTEGKKPTLTECRLFLKAMEDTRIHGVLDPEHVDVSLLKTENHSRAHSEVIQKELSGWFGS
ncbi:hypothetical protein EXS70_00155 [Candidatus Peribacteria bacterium]|nr:hypothetical protein [Candidatus Peribacteria bacterium]